MSFNGEERGSIRERVHDLPPFWERAAPDKEQLIERRLANMANMTGS
jgi:hypothetical protein